MGVIVDVLPSMTSAVAEGAREMVVPEMVRASPPAARVFPAITYCVCAFGVMVWVPMVSRGGNGLGASEMGASVI
jgi:hypothetical protein